jgi:uncharacterized protein (DUF1697 family)
MANRIALLRGINLGPERRVAMAELRAALETAGYTDVRTHLQSGNVLLESRQSPERLARELSALVARELGVESDVVVRTRDELADVVARNPLAEVAGDPKRLQVTFLAGEPDAALVRELESGDFAPEQCVVSGREIYAWHPDGIQRSRLARVLSSGPGTARNWNTVTKLLALAAG